MRAWWWATAGLLALPASAADAPFPPAAHATAAAIAAQVAWMEAALRPGQEFAWARLIGGGDALAALEIWRRPRPPAVHPDQAEYAQVVKGAGVLVSGGRLVDAHPSGPHLVEGSRIEGGERRTLGAGDVFMVPAGVPHWFDVTGGELVLLGTKLPQPATATP